MAVTGVNTRAIAYCPIQLIVLITTNVSLIVSIKRHCRSKRTGAFASQYDFRFNEDIFRNSQFNIQDRALRANGCSLCNGDPF
jgi:hypothetical protein